MPLPFHLAHLSLWLCATPASPTFLTALFSASHQTLTTLRLRLSGITAKNFLLPGFSLAAASLRHLILNTDEDWDVTASTLDLSECSSLERLELGRLRDNETTAPTSFSIFATLLAGLILLGLHIVENVIKSRQHSPFAPWPSSAGSTSPLPPPVGEAARSAT